MLTQNLSLYSFSKLDNTLSSSIDAFCLTLQRMMLRASAGPGYPVLDNVEELINFCGRGGTSELCYRVFFFFTDFWLASGIEAMTNAMKAFVEFVHPSAQDARSNLISKLQSETTVATFLSGVTATSRFTSFFSARFHEPKLFKYPFNPHTPGN